MNRRSLVLFQGRECIIGRTIPRGVRPLYIRKWMECYFTVCDDGNVYCRRNEEYYEPA